MTGVTNRNKKPVPATVENSDSDSASGSEGKGKEVHAHDHKHAHDHDGCCGSEDAESAANKKPEPYNWAAIFLLFLFVSVPLFTAGQYIFDYMYPEAANTRRIYDNVYKCYNAVGDIDKINSIDRFVAKYEGKERSLYSQLRAKYGDEFPECDNFRM
jgi:hypothetical protein